MKVLVTGANGHIGANLVRLLINNGFRVKALVRKTSNRRSIEGVDIDVIEGNILDFDLIKRVIFDCEVVYHLATPSALDPNVIKIAVEGTRNVLEAAVFSKNINKIIYTSSTLTMGFTNNFEEPVDERSFKKLYGTPNQIAKYEAENIVMEYISKKGLPVVIVNPASTFGKFDYRPTLTNKLVVDFLNKRTLFYFNTGLTIVDVEDVAKGHFLAYLKGRIGERYILGGDFVFMRDFYKILSELTGVFNFGFCVPKTALYFFATVAELWAKIPQRKPLVTRQFIKTFVNAYSFHSSRKAVSELGYSFIDHREVLLRTIKWFLNSGLVKDGRRWMISRNLASN